MEYVIFSKVPECSHQILEAAGIFKIFAKFTGKHFTRVLQPAALLKKRVSHKCFAMNFTNTFLKTPPSDYVQNLPKVSTLRHLFNGSFPEFLDQTAIGTDNKVCYF